MNNSLFGKTMENKSVDDVHQYILQDANLLETSEYDIDHTL